VQGLEAKKAELEAEVAGLEEAKEKEAQGRGEAEAEVERLQGEVERRDGQLRELETFMEAAAEEAKQQVRPALRVDRLAEWRC